MVQALAFAELFLGGLFLTSAITKEPLSELLTKGLTNAGKAKQVATESSPHAWGTPVRSGVVAPFTAADVKEWNRSDQGVDVQLNPHVALRAIGDGVVSIEHDPKGFGAEYPMLHLTTGESFYYGHTIPLVKNGAKVHAGDVIAKPNPVGQNSPPNWLEFGAWPPGNMEAGKKIRKWLEKLVKG